MKNKTRKQTRQADDELAPEASSFQSSTLAPVQRQTLEFLRNFLAEHGYAPPLKAIADFIGVKSPSTAHFHLERLENKGFIRRGAEGLLELLDRVTPELGPSAVPLVGVIAAGRPIEAIEQATTIEIPQHDQWSWRGVLP